MAREERGRAALVVLTVVAAPLALAFETALRHLLLPADFELIRAWLRPTLTPIAWALVAACVILGALGLRLQARMVRKAARRRTEPGAPPDLVARARIGGFMLGASIPQIPAIVATFTFMFGASLWPVLVCIVVVTVFVGFAAAHARGGQHADA
jgi:hypothetical protein